MGCALLANSQVQQLLSTLPRQWAADPELSAFYNELLRVTELFYRETFWVNSEASADFTSSSTFSTPIRREHIICTNTSAITVSLNDGSDRNEPFEDQEVMVTAHGTGAVTVDFGNKTWHGLGSIVLHQYDSPNFKWSDIADEWVTF